MPFTAWRTWTEGTRVMVRRRITDDDFRYSDVIGEVVRRDDDGLVLRTRHGEEVEVPADVIAAGKQVPPAPVRRTRPAPPHVDDDDDDEPAGPVTPR